MHCVKPCSYIPVLMWGKILPFWLPPWLVAKEDRWFFSPSLAAVDAHGLIWPCPCKLISNKSPYGGQFVTWKMGSCLGMSWHLFLCLGLFTWLFWDALRNLSLFLFFFGSPKTACAARRCCWAAGLPSPTWSCLAFLHGLSAATHSSAWPQKAARCLEQPTEGLVGSFCQPDPLCWASAPWAPGFGLLIQHLQLFYPLQVLLSNVSCIFKQINPCVCSDTSVFEA